MPEGQAPPCKTPTDPNCGTIDALQRTLCCKTSNARTSAAKHMMSRGLVERQGGAGSYALTGEGRALLAARAWASGCGGAGC
jgi:hypothetical protein